jgi:hypothetical protein
MPDIYLDLRRIDYTSDQGVTLTAWRAYARAMFLTSAGVPVPFACMIDPGAPFSVLPFSLWHDHNLQRTFLGQQLTRQGRTVPEPLTWQGVACDLGDTSAQITDARAGTQAGPFMVIAKLARQRLPQVHLESIALFGMNFLADNSLRLVLEGAGGAVVGYLSVP